MAAVSGPQPRSILESKRQVSLAFIADAVDLVVAVFGYEQAAIGHLQQSDGASPDVRLIRRKHPAVEELLKGTGRLTILERHIADRLADALGAVPGPVKGKERSALIMFRELRACVELEIDHGDMRAQNHVGHDGLFH